MTPPAPPAAPRRLARALAFALLTGALYVAALWAASKVRVGEHTLLQSLVHNTIEPGGRYQSLRRFREAGRAGRVDVVILGSSHAYRGFDPRQFAAEGVSAYNLGSTNQSPLNSYYLARRYLPSLGPRLLLVEVYYSTLSLDGLEAYRDLAVNTPPSWPMLRMAAATENLNALSFAVAKGLRLVADESRVEQRPTDDEVYVGGGYCEARRGRKERSPGGPLAVEIRPRQLDYLQDLSAFARSLGARVLWVTHPLPDDHLRRLKNPDVIRATIAAAAAASGVEYWDWSRRPGLDDLDDFQDFHHLNASGVEKFNRALLDALKGAGYLPASRP